MNKLKLYKVGTLKGYLLSDIKKFLGGKEFEKFEVWSKGETCGIYKGEDLIFKYDFERFLLGLPPFDSMDLS